MFQRDYFFFLLFLLPLLTYCGTFLYIESGFFFDMFFIGFSLNLTASLLNKQKKNLTLLNSACNISTVVLLDQLPIYLRLSTYILITSKEDTVRRQSCTLYNAIYCIVRKQSVKWRRYLFLLNILRFR